MDIEESKILLKDFQKGKIEKDKLETYKGGYKLGYFYTVGIQEAIETVLSELENKQDDINILQAQRDSMEYQFKQAKAELGKKDKRLNRQFKLLQKKDKKIEELKADNSHQWEERCKLTFELEKKDEYIKMLTDERDTLIKERDYYKARYNEFNNAFIKTKEKE